MSNLIAPLASVIVEPDPFSADVNAPTRTFVFSPMVTSEPSGRVKKPTDFFPVSAYASSGTTSDVKTVKGARPSST